MQSGALHFLTQDVMSACPLHIVLLLFPKKEKHVCQSTGGKTEKGKVGISRQETEIFRVLNSIITTKKYC